MRWLRLVSPVGESDVAELLKRLALSKQHDLGTIRNMDTSGGKSPAIGG